MATFSLNHEEFVRLENAMKNFQGDTEQAINEVLHNEGGQLIHDEIKRLMPMSGKRWKGKKPPAKTSNSLVIVGGNLSVTVTTKKAYQYLYFPDDGSNTRRHAGNQQFFLNGGENQKEEILNRCINRLVGSFEDAIN